MKRKITMLLLVLGVSLGSMWTRSAATAQTATLTVTSTGDAQVGAAGCADGCSLREAIAAAQGGDTIVFSALFDTPQTITLSEAQGFQTLGIYKNLTITGKGAQLTLCGVIQRPPRNSVSFMFHPVSRPTSPA